MSNQIYKNSCEVSMPFAMNVVKVACNTSYVINILLLYIYIYACIYMLSIITFPLGNQKYRLADWNLQFG